MNYEMIIAIELFIILLVLTSLTAVFVVHEFTVKGFKEVLKEEVAKLVRAIKRSK